MGGNRDLASTVVGSPSKPEKPSDDRYELIERLGEGAMGVVWEARDRTLDRRVAMKVLNDRFLGAAHQARLADEARAMARLSHRNVVAVYDVGEREGRTYLTMELIRGVDLATWLRTPRTWREIVDVFRAAGAGLAAAHAAGIVHRDVKPSNILIGDDGEVRVADFGVAHAGAAAIAGDSPVVTTTTTGLIGSPAYMAPEQLAGEAADALSDQFGFCVSLYEGLHGRRPWPSETFEALRDAIAGGVPPPVNSVPSWLTAVVARGLAADRTRRFASMQELVAALAGPRPRWHWIAAATAVLVIGGAVAAFTMMPGDDGPGCAVVERELDGIWDPAARARVNAGFATIGKPWATATARGVLPLVDAYATEWVAARRRACEGGRARGEAAVARQERCLDDRRRALGQLVRSLATATDKTADRASALVDGLPAVTDCESAAYLDTVTTEVASGDAREQLSLALIHRIAGRGKEAAPLIEQVIASARAARDRTLEAEALALRGRLEVDLGQHGVAIDTLRAAVAAATQAPHVRIDAWIHMAYALDVVGQSEQAGQVLVLAKTALRDAPDPAREARLLNIEGVLLARKGRYAEALALHERGRALDETVHGPEAVSQVMYLENTTIALRRLDRTDDAIGETRRALKIQLTFGEHHPAVARQRRELGQMLAGLGKFEDAYRELDAARSIFTRAFGERHFEVGVTETAYGVALSREPRHREAVKRLRAGLAIREEVEPGSRKSWPLRTNLAAELIEIGELDEAERHLAELLPARIASLGKTHPDVAWNRSQLARVSFERGKHAEAIAGYQASRQIYVELYGPKHSKVALALAYEAEVERARKRFARALELDEESLRIARATASADRVTILPAVLAVVHDRLLLGDSQRALALIEETLPRAKPDDHQLHFLHAWALWDTGKDRVRALELARAARAAIAPLAAEQRVLARLLPELDAWLAKRSP